MGGKRFYILQRFIMVRVFAKGPGDLGSIPGRAIPKTQKTVLDANLLNTQHYKVRINGKVERSRERNSASSIEKAALCSPSTTVANFIDSLLSWRVQISIIQLLYIYIYIFVESYKSPGVPNIWWVIYRFINFMKKKFIKFEEGCFPI